MVLAILIQARIEKRIGRISHDKTVPTFTAWDLGYNDSTAIWFFQIVGKEIHLIDYIEGSEESFAHWLGIVKERGYVYEKHFGPHDLDAHEYSTGLTRQAAARKMGISFTVAPRGGIIEGIDAARNLFNRCWFDEQRCGQGIRALENYKKEWNERTGTWNSHPKHDWSSHCADAFRTLAVSIHLANTKKEQPVQCLDYSGLSPKHSLFGNPNLQYMKPIRK